MTVPRLPFNSVTVAFLNSLQPEELLEFAVNEYHNPILSNDEMVQQLLIERAGGIPRESPTLPAGTFPTTETASSLAFESVEGHVSASDSQRRSGRLSRFPVPEYIEDTELVPTVVYRETETGFIANIIGARAGTALIPVDTTSINTVPTYTASVAVPAPAEWPVSEWGVLGGVYEAEASEAVGGTAALPKKTRRLWHQRQPLKGAKVCLRAYLSKKHALFQPLAKKVKALQTRRGFMYNTDLSAALDMPVREGLASGSSRYTTESDEEGEYPEVDEFGVWRMIPMERASTNSMSEESEL